MRTHASWLVGLLALVFAGCESVPCSCDSFSESLRPGGLPDRNYSFPWIDLAQPVVSELQRVNVVIGAKSYSAEYGPDPILGGAAAGAVITERGKNWRQTQGHFYLWGHWLLFETERTRAFTWGTSVGARMITDASGEREQIIVRCGKILLMPREPTDTTFQPLWINATDASGNTVPKYVVVSVTTDATGVEHVDVEAVTNVPTAGTEPNPDQIFEYFHDWLLALHPDCDL